MAFAVAGARAINIYVGGIGLESFILLAGAANSYLFAGSADGILQQRRTTNPQQFHIFNTYTSTVNNEFLRLGFISNVAYLETVKGSSGGTLRNLCLQSGLGKLGVDSSAPDKKVEINEATGQCLRLTYNDSNGSAANYVDFLVSSAGLLTITASGGIINTANDVEVTDTTKGIILKSPDGSRFRVTVNNDGALITTEI